MTSNGWMGHEGSGSWQQYINLPSERVVSLPDGISDEAGAQFFVSHVDTSDVINTSDVISGMQPLLHWEGVVSLILDPRGGSTHLDVLEIA